MKASKSLQNIMLRRALQDGFNEDGHEFRASQLIPESLNAIYIGSLQDARNIGALSSLGINWVLTVADLLV